MTGGLRKRRTRFFVQVDRGTVRDGRLTFRDLGVLTYILDKPDGWEVRAEEITASGENREGREAIRTSLRNLSRYGYRRLERRRLLDGTFAMGSAFSEEPVQSWADQARFFGDKAVPLVQQDDGTFLVRYPDGALLPDDFPPPERIDDDTTTGAQKPVSGSGSTPVPKNPASGYPASGYASPKEDATGDMREGRSSSPDGPPAGGDPARKEEAVEILRKAQTLGGAGRRTIQSPRRLGRLADRLVLALDAGWTAEDLADRLGGPLGTAGDVYAVLSSRITDVLDETPPPTRAAPPPQQRSRWTVPWCGSCDGATNRRAYANPLNATDQTLAGPCPRCGTDEHRLVSVA